MTPSSSIIDHKPKVGMRVDARDVDFIWSPATVVKVYSRKHKVTVCFDGWKPSYNETLHWNGDRLAPLYTFTKCVKCLVDILPKKRSSPTESQLELLPDSAPEVYSNMWPCKVQFRMPHPLVEGDGDEEDCADAGAFLASEGGIFIQPYEKHYLPHNVQHSLKEHDGMWITVERVMPWKDNPFELGVLPDKFMETFRLAKLDNETPGVLVPDAIDKGSLLKEEYLVHSREGAEVRDGALHKEEDEEGEEEEVDEEGEDEEDDEEEEEVKEHVAESSEEEEDEPDDIVDTAPVKKQPQVATKVVAQVAAQVPTQVVRQQAPRIEPKPEMKSLTSNCVIS